jgi:hypothetical protein
MFQQEQNLNEKQKVYLNQPIVKFVLLSINSCIGWRTHSRIRTLFIKLKGQGLDKCSLEGCSDLYIMYGKAYNYSPYLAAMLLLLWPRIKKKRNDS